MGFAARRQLLIWTAIPLLVGQVGCATQGVRAPADPRPATASEADQAKCDAFARDEAKSAGTASTGKAFGRWWIPMATGSIADIVLLPLSIAVGLVGGTIDAGWTAHKNAGEGHAAYARARDLCLTPALMAQRLGPEHLEVARSLEILADRYVAQGKFTEAEPLYERALAIKEKAPEAEVSDVATTLESYAAVLRKMNRQVEAEPMETRAKAIREKPQQGQTETPPSLP